ncbi:peptidylprolyl isomerase [Candidatus Woesearchaeota archaeon]|jgi:FKBP-type peptidyl-prolyl cis-trans isomerase SlyD|nr:peptidylprolyl isomerase [Candidatus Woesearchaeota archaeon]
MSEKVKKGDFVEIEYTGSIKEGGLVFDSTSEEESKNAGTYNPKMIYGPVKICIGQKQVIPGLDEVLDGADENQESQITIKAENAFGKKDSKLLKLMPASKFKSQQINPMPGLQLNIDGMMATIRSVSGGRVVVDFNHPLSGKEVFYKYKILKKITDPKEKVKGYLALILSAKENQIQVSITDSKAEITLTKEIPQEFLTEQKNKIIELIPEIKEIEFKINKVTESK